MGLVTPYVGKVREAPIIWLLQKYPNHLHLVILGVSKKQLRLSKFTKKIESEKIPQIVHVFSMYAKIELLQSAKLNICWIPKIKET